jgi:phage terminase large subunit
MEEQSVMDAKLAVRGVKYTLTLFTTNPYALAHWFVSFYVKKLPPNRKILTEKGYMTKIFPETKELVHLTNYRVNPGITQEKIDDIESMKLNDPLRYDVVGLGLPGIPQGGVYAHLIKHVSRLMQIGNVYTAGLD